MTSAMRLLTITHRREFRQGICYHQGNAASGTSEDHRVTSCHREAPGNSGMVHPWVHGSCAGKAGLRLWPETTNGRAIVMARPHSREFGYYLLVKIASAAFCVSLIFLNGCAGPTSYKPDREITSHEIARHKESRRASCYQRGIASYYGRGFQNKKTASGERFNLHSMTAAHKTLPFGTKVIVKNIHNGKTVKVRINDRGPFVKGRIIDLTRAAFSQIASLDDGLAKVEIRIVK
jgi:rare lipoprotein A